MQPISVIIPACLRVDCLERLLRKLRHSTPAPNEILVHVDGGNMALMEPLRETYPEVQWLVSDIYVGPGGARNRLVAAARHELVANFDDDSFPDQPDYFARVRHTVALFPHAAVISAAGQPSEWTDGGFCEIAVFSGCGCVFRKSWFQRVRGFVPLPIAYNMEEVDVSLQLHAIGGKIIHDPELRVKHEHPEEPRDGVNLAAEILSNTALLPFLRYPLWLLPVGLLHVLSMVLWMVRNRTIRAIPPGLARIPARLHANRRYRCTVPGGSVLSWIWLRRRPHWLTCTN